MNYYIFRHGESFFSKFKLPYGPFQDSAQILTTGVPAVSRLANYLKDISSDANFSSPYLRCQQTVEIVEKITNKKFVFDNLLREYRRETISQMEQRLADFLNEVKRKDYQNVIICSHGWPIVCLVDLITKGKLVKKDLKKYPKPGVLVCIKKGVVKEINFNIK